MTKKFITFSFIITLFSCITTKEEIKIHKSLTTQIITNTKGEQINIKFDNIKNLAIIDYKGERTILLRKKSASGIWYSNNNFELSGKGDNLVFKKNNNVIFENNNNITYVETKSGNDTLNLTFNNATNTVKVYFNGGQEINLKETITSSGIFYINEEYVLSRNGYHYELKKHKEIIFKN